MPDLALNKTVTQKAPRLEVTNSFKAGRYVFRLVVEDDAGNTSGPAQMIVTVKGSSRPVIDSRIANPGRAINRDGLVRPVRRNPTSRRPN